MLDAIRFLTVLPAPGARQAGPPDRRALASFPAVGALIGLVWLATASGAHAVWRDAAVAAALVLIVDAALTGGLHLDALADVADGVASRRGAEDAVAIMREPAIGAVGAVALILVLLLRWVWLGMIGAAPALIAAPVAGRTAMVLLVWRVPPRAHGSLASAFGAPARLSVAVAATTAVAAVALPALAPGGPALLAGLGGLVGALLFALAYGAWWRRRFGPLIGDAAGACGLLAETVALGALAALVR